MKQVSLELGGKSPMIVFESADLEEAAKWCAFGAFECGGEVLLAFVILELKSQVNHVT